MSKQEEIEDTIGSVIRHWNQFSISANWQSLYGGATVSQDIILGLHSQGAVTKVERELPLQVVCNKCHEIFDLSNEGLKWAGYVVVENLIP